LADIGWQGLYIEPVADYARRCFLRHQKNAGVKLLHCAIGAVEKEIEIHVGGPRNFDVMSIDVEGYEWQVVQNFPIQQWEPSLVIVELHDTNPEYQEEWPSNNLVASYFRDNRYEVLYKDFSNTVYRYHTVRQRALG
jgi:hypothetical protein